jgi:hypothetical protein
MDRHVTLHLLWICVTIILKKIQEITFFFITSESIPGMTKRIFMLAKVEGPKLFRSIEVCGFC